MENVNVSQWGPGRATAAAGGAVSRLQQRPGGRVLPTALLLGWGAEILFYGHRPGVAVPLYVAILVGALFSLGRLEGVRPVRRNLWLLPPLFFFATMVAVRDNELLTLLNLGATGALLALYGYFYAAGRVTRLGVVGYPLVVLQVLLAAGTRPAPALAAAVREVAGGRRRVAAVLPLLRGIALALPVLLVLTALLSSADSIFAGYVGDAVDFWSLEALPEGLWRLTFVLGASWVLAGGLLFALARRRRWSDVDDAEALPGVGAPSSRLGFVEGATVLALVDLLFAAFVWVQLAYLFSGQAARQMAFEDYRLYARRGFGELVVVTVLTLCLILGLRWLTSKRTVRQAFAYNVLSSVMIGLSLVMLASAFQRLMAWESVEFYVNTEVRLYVRTFVVWLAATYGWLLLTLWLRQDRFAAGACIAALGFLITVNVLNPDADVARYNLARDDDLSTRYLHLLSDDAVPVLAAGLDGASPAVRDELRRHLSRRLQTMEAERPAPGSPGSPGSWPELHLSRYQAYRALLALRAAGKLGAD